MLYLIHGTDTLTTRQKFDGLIASLLAKKTDSSFFLLDRDRFAIEKLRELAVSQDLFVNKYVVGLTRLFQDKKNAAPLLETLPILKQSDNIFILLEEILDEALLKDIRLLVEKELLFNAKVSTAPSSFNIFSLTDALGERNRKQSWLLFTQALRADFAAEEIFWKFSWLVHHLLFLKKTKNPDQSELKGFAKKKMLGFLKNYSVADLEQFSTALVDLFHQSRRGEADIEIGLEKLILCL